MKPLSLRGKIVMMACAIVTAACLFLTAISISSANKYMRSMVSYDVNSFEQNAAAPAPSQDGTREDGFLGQDSAAPRLTEIEENQKSYQIIMNGFARNALLSMLITILVLASAVYILTGKILRPLSLLTQFMGEMDDKNISQRAELPKSKDEVYRLTRSFNHMMDRLERSYTVQKNFAANAAHELKTPLSIMKASLQVLELQDEPSREDYRECTGDVKQSMDRLIQTVESLMTLTDPSLKDETEIIDALSAANQIREDLAPLAEEKGVRMTVTGEALQFPYNKDLFYRIMFNLVENAVKYNREGGCVNIVVSGRERYILIKDDGIGMDRQAVQNIYQPFYRSDLSRSQRIPGSGLGMSIVKTVMDRYGGTLEINSDLGRGTEVKFKI